MRLNYAVASILNSDATADKAQPIDLVALHYAREIFHLKNRIAASGFKPVSAQLEAAIDLLDKIWMQGDRRQPGR